MSKATRVDTSFFPISFQSYFDTFDCVQYTVRTSRVADVDSSQHQPSIGEIILFCSCDWRYSETGVIQRLDWFRHPDDKTASNVKLDQPINGRAEKYKGLRFHYRIK